MNITQKVHKSSLGASGRIYSLSFSHLDLLQFDFHALNEAEATKSAMSKTPWDQKSPPPMQGKALPRKTAHYKHKFLQLYKYNKIIDVLLRVHLWLTGKPLNLPLCGFQLRQIMLDTIAMATVLVGLWFTIMGDETKDAILLPSACGFERMTPRNKIELISGSVPPQKDWLWLMWVLFDAASCSTISPTSAPAVLLLWRETGASATEMKGPNDKFQTLPRMGAIWPKLWHWQTPGYKQ